LVERAIQLGLTVTPISGPSAFLLALTASGLPCNRFSFQGFLPNNKTQRKLRLESLIQLDQTLVFYVAPHDLRLLIPEIHKAFGPRQACLAKEITKKHERFIYGPLDTLLSQLEEKSTKGEFVLVVEGAQLKPVEYSEEQIIDKLRQLTKQGIRLSDAAAQIAKISDWPRSKIYKLGMSTLKQ
jgi:16S rRNA (cytidine1402-2'-O)-methyltransferase